MDHLQPIGRYLVDRHLGSPRPDRAPQSTPFTLIEPHSLPINLGHFVRYNKYLAFHKFVIHRFSRFKHLLTFLSRSEEK